MRLNAELRAVGAAGVLWINIAGWMSGWGYLQGMAPKEECLSVLTASLLSLGKDSSSQLIPDYTA